MTSETQEYQVTVDNDNDNAVDLLATKTGFSKQKIKQIMQKGAVWLTNNKGTHRLRRKSKKLTSGSTVHLYYDPSVLNEYIPTAVLIADEGDYSVWYKPRGMLSQGSKWGDHCAINRYVEQHLEPQRPAFIVHRLDRFASGLILIAHKKKVATLLANLFKDKTIHKQYKVIVEGKFPEQQNFTNEIDGKSAISHASLLKYDSVNNESLVCVSIETGRKHQIRKHLSEAGFPVVGDRSYGTEDDRDLQLTAFKINFVCPITQSQKEFTLDNNLQPQLKADT
ncbi:MAG: RluA family pseudouridine synthase [Woeseiaceae bacterium]